MAAARALPAAPSALVGRAAEVAAIRGLLLDGSTRLITLTGPPGVGKTRLALAVAAGVAGAFADGVAWISLASVRSSADVDGELARGLGLTHAGAGAVGDTLAGALADRELLIVIDNFEHVLGAAPLIGGLIDRLPHLRVLTTSRRRLQLSAEHECAVPPLRMPADTDADDLARLADNPAVQLVLARAPAHVTLTRRTARPLVDICLRLDGLPLALELAAARLRVFTPGELAFRLEHRTAGLIGSARDAPTRHRNLSAAIAWSHELLPETERATFRRLSVFAGSWTLSAAEAVCDQPAPTVLAAVETLIDQSLVQSVPNDGPAHFVLLTSIRDFAAEQLATSGEQAAVRDQHADHFARAGREWEEALGTDAENENWAEFDARHADLAAALDHTGSAEATAWLGTALAWYAHTRGSLVQADAVLSALQNVLGAIDAGSMDSGSVDSRPIEAGVPTTAVMEAVTMGAGAVNAVSDDARTAASTAAGVVALGRSELTRAETDLRRAIAISQARGDDRRQAIASAFLGHTLRALGHRDDAARSYRSARDIFERLGSVRGRSWAAYDLGLLAVDDVDAAHRATAVPLLREALTYFEDLDYDWAIAQAARGLATALLERGEVEEAAGLLGRSLVLHERVGDRRGSAQCLHALAGIAAVRGSPAVAARLIGAAEHQHRLAAATLSEAEQKRWRALDAAVDAALGRAGADHERHGGRTSSRAAVLDLAAAVADPVTAAPPAAVVLTARQDEVARLIASGRTNRQIGRALGISEKTAEVHVRNIMTRLDAPSRAGVAAWVAARPPPEFGSP